MLNEIERRQMLFAPVDPDQQMKEKRNDEIQKMLMDFIRRVSSENGNKTSAEIKILPEMIRLALSVGMEQ